MTICTKVTLYSWAILYLIPNLTIKNISPSKAWHNGIICKNFASFLASLVWFDFEEYCLSVAVTHNYMIQSMGTRWALGILNNVSSVSNYEGYVQNNPVSLHNKTRNV